MSPRIGEVTIKPVRLTPTEAELAVEIGCASSQASCDVHGRLMGPTCLYSTTVEVAYPIRRLHLAEGGPPKLVGRVVIPEPAWWDPESPFLYVAVLERWQDGSKVEEQRLSCGLRTAKLTPTGLRWNGGPLDLQAHSQATRTESEWAHARADGFNAIVVPVSVADAAWEYGDRVGLLIVTDQSRRADPVRHPSALGWMADGELRLN